MSQPTQTCRLCGAVEVVRPDGRGFPPDIAKRRLKRRCKANGCPSEPTYRAGLSPALEALLAAAKEHYGAVDATAARDRDEEDA